MRSRSANALVRSVRESADHAVEQAGLRRDDLVATVVGSPGVLNLGSRSFGHVPNLPGWENFPIRDRLSELCGRPVTFSNDAGAAASRIDPPTNSMKAPCAAASCI